MQAPRRPHGCTVVVPEPRAIEAPITACGAGDPRTIDANSESYALNGSVATSSTVRELLREPSPRHA